MSEARTGGGVKHKRAELCLRAFISILFLQQCVTVPSLPRVETTQEQNTDLCKLSSPSLHFKLEARREGCERIYKRSIEV